MSPAVSLHTPRPRRKKKPVTLEAHGRKRVDEYHWMRANNWQQVMREPDTLPADIRSHLDAENAYADVLMADTEGLQEALFKEMRGRIKENDSTVPAPHGPWAYATRFVTGGEYPIIVREPRGGGEGEVLLDGNAMAEGHSYFSFGDASHAPDHNRIGYSVDDNGSEYYTIRVRDVATGRDLDDEIPDTSGAVVWAGDSNTFFYVLVDENHRPYAVMRHTVGTPRSSDVEVYREADPAYFVNVGTTLSKAFIQIVANDHETSEVRLIPSEAPDRPPQLVAPRRTGHEYSVEHRGDDFVILTNRDDAEDFKIMTTPVASPGMENWTEIEPHRPGRLILSVAAFKDYLVRLEREGGLPRIVIRDYEGGKEHDIAFDEEAYSLGLSVGFEHDTSTMRFSYSSMTTPGQVFDYDMATRERTLRKTQEVPSGHDANDYITRRIMAPASDGERVPVSLLYHRTTPLDGSAPLYLYGYGSYGISMPASFSVTRLSVVDRGFIYAIAHIRGGKDKGYGWYANGKREHKKNTFTDFIAAGEHLVSQGFTKRGHIVAEGGSAGGLLMGAVTNIAPDLFAGIVAYVPFVDVLSTILDDTLPLTPPEWTEWGNPITSPEVHDFIASYSPYDNVTAQDYPPIFAIAGLTDPRVTYWEPAKWVARLRERRTDQNPVLMKMNMAAGHGGASGRFERLKEVALGYAFALKVTGRTGASV